MPRGVHSNHVKGADHYRWRGGSPIPDAARRRTNAKASNARYPDRRRAREKVKDAVRAGKLPRITTLSCVDCGDPAKRYDHHKGYDYPLSVEPVCFKCDGQRMKARGELKVPHRNNGLEPRRKVTEVPVG